MKFEEEFPNLINEGFDVSDQNKEADYLFTDMDVQKHCLDKRRVKEAIEKEFDRTNGTSMSCSRIFEELGIEK